MPRFVILRHELPADAPRPTHFDLMFEQDGVLRTWACAENPAAGCTAVAERLSDHRLEYLDYEGPLTSDRGSVQRVDCGTYEPLLAASHAWHVQLAGTKLRGKLAVVQERDDLQRWRVSFEPDGPAR